MAAYIDANQMFSTAKHKCIDARLYYNAAKDKYIDARLYYIAANHNYIHAIQAISAAKPTLEQLPACAKHKKEQLS